MSRVLVLAYHFPPIGGGGVQRNAKTVRYLPDFGHGAIVVTGPGHSADRWTPADATLADDVGEAAVVHRISQPEPSARAGVRGALEWRLMRPSRFQLWWTEHAVELALGVGAEADAVLASLVPYQSAEASALISRRLGKPWIADLQDPWALDEMWPYPSALHRSVDRRRMRAYLRDAAAVVMNTPTAADRVRRAFPELERTLVVAIPNGFDAADFAGEPPARDDGRFRIVHTGYLHTDQGFRLRRTRRARRLFGGSDPVDILPRSHVFLLQALERLLAKEPALRDTIEVVLAGVTTETDRAIGDASPVRVTFTGYLPHAETVALMRSADLLFLPMHDLPPGRRAGLVPGKTYEYLAARRPILAAVPDGDARELLTEAGNARICRPTDVEAMSRAVHAEIERWQSGAAAPDPREDVVARYDRRELTRQLAAVIDAVADEGRGTRTAAVMDATSDQSGRPRARWLSGRGDAPRLV